MRSVALVTVSALTFVSGARVAAADERALALRDRPAAPARGDQAPPRDASFHVDVSDLWQLAGGSPIAIRFATERAAHRAPSARARRELAVFRATQGGAFDPLIADAAETWALDPFLLKGLLYNESNLDPTLTGKRIFRRVGGRLVAVGGGARGIAQFTTAGISAVNEAREKRYRRGDRVRPLRRDDVWDPELAIPAAAELLATYIDRFGRDGGITAYNSGPYGGRLVAKHGFYRARRSGKLARKGRTALQGYRFLLNVLRRTNQFRRASGLPKVRKPRDRRTRAERRIDRLLQLRKRLRRGREPNS